MRQRRGTSAMSPMRERRGIVPLRHGPDRGHTTVWRLPCGIPGIRSRRCSAANRALKRADAARPRADEPAPAAACAAARSWRGRRPPASCSRPASRCTPARRRRRRRCRSTTASPRISRARGEVRVQSWGGAFQDAQREAYFLPFQELSGITVIESEGPDTSKIKAMVDTGNVEQDVVQEDRSERHLPREGGRLLGGDRLLALRRREHRRGPPLQVLGRHAPLRDGHRLSQRRLPGGAAGPGRLLEPGDVPWTAHDRRAAPAA